MQIIFKDAQDGGMIRVTNDDLDNDNYVTLTVGSEVVDVSIDDFLHAFNVFKEIRIANIEHDKRYGSR